MNIFEILFYQPIYNIIAAFYHLLGDNLGFAIICTGIASRVILIPLMLKQTKMTEISKEYNEKVKALKKKYKNNKKKLQEEMFKIQQEYLPDQLRGCLPLIFQLIIVLNIYSVIRNIVSSGAEGFNSIAYSFVPLFGESINGTFLWGAIDLKLAFTQAGSLVNQLPYLIIVLLVGLTQFLSMKVVMSKKPKKEVEVVKNKKQQEPEDFAEIMQKATEQTMIIFPFFLIVLSIGLPSGLNIYLITTSTFVLVQQIIMKYLKARREKSKINETNN